METVPKTYSLKMAASETSSIVRSVACIIINTASAFVRVQSHSILIQACLISFKFQGYFFLKLVKTSFKEYTTV